MRSTKFLVRSGDRRSERFSGALTAIFGSNTSPNFLSAKLKSRISVDFQRHKVYISYEKIFAGIVYRHFTKGTRSNISATRLADNKRSGVKKNAPH